MLAAYLLNYTVKDDITYLANNLDYEMPTYDKKEELTEDEYIKRSIDKAIFIHQTQNKLNDKMIEHEVIDLYNKIELPLSKVLAEMELNGISVESKILEDMKEEIKKQIETISEEIYKQAGTEFNISS